MFTVKSSSVLLVLALLLVSTSRAIPALLNNAVFSTDSWPLIRLARLLQSNPETRVLSLSEHHAKWPSAVLASLIYTLVTSIDVYSFYAYAGAPIVVFALAVLLYASLERLAGSAQRALGLLALLVYTPFLVFTSAYLKEVYSYPLALLVLYSALGLRGASKWLLVLLATTALVLSHPLTALITLVFAPTYLFTELTERVKYGGALSLSYRNTLLLTLVLGALYSLHALLVGVYYAFTPQDIIVLGAYGAVFYGVYFAVYASKQSSAITAVLFVAVLATMYSLLVEGLEVSYSIVLHAAPVALLATSLLDPRSAEARLSAGVLLPVVAGISYTLTYAKWLVTTTHRFLNYLVFPLTLLVLLLSKTKPRLLVLVLLLLVLNSYFALYQVSTGRDPAVFYWRYTLGDLVLGDFLREYSTRPVVAGAKYSYLLGSGVATTSLDLLSLSTPRACSSGERLLLVVSRDELVYGVPVSPLHYIKLTSNTLHCSSVVYSSLLGYVVVR